MVFSRFNRVRGPIEQAYQLAADESFSFFKDEMRKVVLIEDRLGLLRWVSKFGNAPGFVFEFGVMDGASLRVLCNRCARATVVGFDGFVGLTEDWTGTRFGVGAVGRGGRVPDGVRALRAEVVPGLVEETLVPFLGTMGEGRVRLVHMDLDTYGPTRFVLENLRPRLESGCVIVFDEFYNYPGWRDHEFRALGEVFDRSEYDFVAFGSMSAAIRLR